MSPGEADVTVNTLDPVPVPSALLTVTSRGPMGALPAIAKERPEICVPRAFGTGVPTIFTPLPEMLT